MSEKGTKTILRIAEKLERSQQENIELVKQNKRYREALESLSGLECIENCLGEEVIEVARMALEGEQ